MGRQEPGAGAIRYDLARCIDPRRSLWETNFWNNERPQLLNGTAMLPDNARAPVITKLEHTANSNHVSGIVEGKGTTETTRTGECS